MFHDFLNKCLYKPPSTPTSLPSSRYFWLEKPTSSKSKNKYCIPVSFIEYPGAVKTILYSHGNAEDLGLIYDYLQGLSQMLQVNMCAYDYSGYGLSIPYNERNGHGLLENENTPSEEKCNSDICAVYKYLTTDRGIHCKNIILYGRSLGGGPSCFLASKTWNNKKNKRDNGVGGLILHSTFSSVFRVVVDFGFTLPGDIFPNIDRIGDVRCPVFILHGTKDMIIPYSNGKALYNALREECRVSPYWARGMGHNNIDIERAASFQEYLIKYIALVSKKYKFKNRTN